MSNALATYPHCAGVEWNAMQASMSRSDACKERKYDGLSFGDRGAAVHFIASTHDGIGSSGSA